MTERKIATPDDLLSISEAVSKLQKAMFARLERPEPLKRHEKAFRGISVTADVHLCEAKKHIREAALKGRLRIYTRPDSDSLPYQLSHDGARKTEPPASLHYALMFS